MPDTYQREVFERFWAAGVDLTADDALASALAHSTQNRPLHGPKWLRYYNEQRPHRALGMIPPLTKLQRAR